MQLCELLSEKKSSQVTFIFYSVYTILHSAVYVYNTDCLKAALQ